MSDSHRPRGGRRRGRRVVVPFVVFVLVPVYWDSDRSARGVDAPDLGAMGSERAPVFLIPTDPLRELVPHVHEILRHFCRTVVVGCRVSVQLGGDVPVGQSLVERYGLAQRRVLLVPTVAEDYGGCPHLGNLAHGGTEIESVSKSMR